MGELKIQDGSEGTGIAAVKYNADGFVQLRVYYQTFEDSYLKEYCHNNKGWYLGKSIYLYMSSGPLNIFIFPKRRIRPRKSTIQNYDRCRRLQRSQDRGLLA